MLIHTDKGEIYMFFKRKKAKVSKYAQLIALAKSIIDVMKK